jgi:aspartyl aminopeptidase
MVFQEGACELTARFEASSAIGGAKEEFIFSGRLDNLCSVYTALKVR